MQKCCLGRPPGRESSAKSSQTHFYKTKINRHHLMCLANFTNQNPDLALQQLWQKPWLASLSPCEVGLASAGPTSSAGPVPCHTAWCAPVLCSRCGPEHANGHSSSPRKSSRFRTVWLIQSHGLKSVGPAAQIHLYWNMNVSGLLHITKIRFFFTEAVFMRRSRMTLTSNHRNCTEITLSQETSLYLIQI